MSSRWPRAAARSNVERRVGLGEVVVRADLDRPVAGVATPSSVDPRRHRRSVSIDAVRREHLARGSRDRLVHGDELGAVGEGRLDLHLVDHLGHALHDVVAGEHRAPGLHQLGDAAAVAGALQHERR